MKPALLLVDLQADYLSANGLQPVPESLIRRAGELLHGCRQKNVPVLHIWTTLHRDNDRRLPHWKKLNRWQCVAGTPGHKTPAPLRPLKTECIIHKSGFNGFAGGGLDAALKQMNCNTVVIAGIYLQTCVRTLAAESLERGLNVFIAEDAVANNDPIYAAATRRWLAGRGTEFISATEILSRLDGNAPSKLIHRSPRKTQMVLFEIPSAGTNEIAAATLSAQKARKIWGRTMLDLRRDIFEKVAARLEAASMDFAGRMAVEIGKPVSHGLEEVRRAARNVRDIIYRTPAFEFEKRERAGMVRHRPLGVVALISPWNNPVAIPLGKIAPALVYGNTIVWKPAPAATNISKLVLKLLHECGLPRGAIQLLTGDHATAQLLAADENINAVTITGSSQAGFAIHEICARRFLPLQAELSGNNAAIVWDDTDLRVAAKQIARGAFGFAGQRCTANRRAIVSGRIARKFLRELKIAAKKLNWGDPLKKSTEIGPVIHMGKRADQSALISAAQAAGVVRSVELLFSRRAKQAWAKNGAYAQPAIVCCDDPEHPLVQEETMSPLLVVQVAEGFDHALKLCNGVRHGLAAALFSSSKTLQKKFRAEAHAGVLKFNSATTGVDVSLPFGGWKMSGFGPPEHGESDPLFYTRTQTVYD